MQVTPLHTWDLLPAEAKQLQTQLAQQLISDEPIELEKVRLVAGVDVSVVNHHSQAAVVVLSYPDLTLREVATAQRTTDYPYIAGLLTFREAPVILDALAQLQAEPDVFIFDGMGQIHPRRMGIAAHLGLWLNRPTIGCGKTHFIGQYDEPAPERGATSPLLDKQEQLGVVLRTRANVKPVYISVGHRATLDSAVQLVMTCTTKYRLPEPIRLAHHTAGQWE